MFSNVQAVNIANIGRKPLFNARNYEPKNFVQNSYAVQGDLEHPESRTEQNGKNVYYLA